MNTNIVDTLTFPVMVLAVADKPTLAVTSPIVLDEDIETHVSVVVGLSDDGQVDDSETLSIRFTVDQSGAIGTLVESIPDANVMWDVSQMANGIYVVEASGGTSAVRKTTLDAYLVNNPVFVPAAHISGNYTSGILVDAISTEGASGTDLADSNNITIGTGNDTNTKEEICSESIDLVINPIADEPEFYGGVAKTVVEENLGSTTDAFDLEIDIGMTMNLTFNDLDRSERVTLSLSGFPLDALDLSFSPGVPTSVTVNDAFAPGTVFVEGDNVTEVKAALDLLSVTLFNDEDNNFDITIDGTVTDEDHDFRFIACFAQTCIRFDSRNAKFTEHFDRRLAFSSSPFIVK